MDGKGKIWIMKRNSKLVLYGYRSLIFFVLLSGVCVINMLQGESWRLFFYDLKRGFADNREFMKKFAVLMILLTGWIIWSEWGITGRVRLKWRIQVGKYQCEYYNCKYLDQLYIPTIVITLILVSCILWQMINDFHAAESSAWEGTETQNIKYRNVTTIDIFPTTLAALGVEIDGDRLGLGTNAFSDRQTLIEELGEENFGTELKKYSRYYNDVFVKGE